MLPFTTSLLRLSLVPLEIARAYREAFLPAASIVAPKLPVPKVDPSRGCAVGSGKVMSYGNGVPSDQSTNSVKAMSTQFYDTQVSTVNYQILFTKRDKEALLDSGLVIVTSAMAASGFASWQISRFMGTLNSKAAGPGGAPAAGDGILKPADWTDDEAIELATEVYPAPAVKTTDLLKAADRFLQNSEKLALARAARSAADDAVAATPGDNNLLDARAAARAAVNALDVANPNPVEAANQAATLFRAASAAAAARPPVQKVIGLKPQNLKYLQVDYQIVSTLDRKPPRYEEDQIGVLRDIATAIKNK